MEMIVQSTFESTLSVFEHWADVSIEIVGSETWIEGTNASCVTSMTDSTLKLLLRTVTNACLGDVLVFFETDKDREPVPELPEAGLTLSQL